MHSSKNGLILFKIRDRQNKDFAKILSKNLVGHFEVHQDLTKILAQNLGWVLLPISIQNMQIFVDFIPYCLS
jgi:hypothetical protein